MLNNESIEDYSKTGSKLYNSKITLIIMVFLFNLNVKLQGFKSFKSCIKILDVCFCSFL